MLNVSEEVKALYKSSSAPITLQLRIGNTTYTDRNVVAGSMSITESLCSLETFSLSTVEKNELVFSLFNEEQEISSLIGQTVVASHIVTLTNNTTETVPLGTYTIVNAVKDGDYIFTCTCYDAMLAFDTIVDDWWNEDVQFPVTIKALAESLFTELNLTYSLPTTFANSDFEIAVRPTYFENIKASEVLGYIQEVSGGFFKADRQGTIRFYGMRQFTNGVGFGENASVIEYTYRHMFGELNISDYDINKITSLQIRGTENDVGIIVGTGTNLFIIEGNPLLYNVTEDDRPMATNIFNAIKDITYTPFSGEVVGLPFVEVGDCINATTYKNATVNSPILYRVLSNQKLSVDSFTTKGEKQRPVTKTLNRAITVLNQKTHEIVNTVEELSSTITQVETDLSGQIQTNTTAIQQNATNITLQAQKIGNCNYIQNSNFTSVNGVLDMWSTQNEDKTKYYCEIVDDAEYKNSNGKALQITKTADAAGTIMRYYQTYNFGGTNLKGKKIYFLFDATIPEELSGKVAAYVCYQVEGSTTWHNAIFVSIVPASTGKKNSWRFTSDPITEDTYVTKMIAYVPYPYVEYYGTYKVNNLCLLILDSDADAPAFGTWTDLSKNNLISQINLSPEGLRINADKLTVDTSSLDLTFGSALSQVKITKTPDDDGVLFSGSGKVWFRTKGEFWARNYSNLDGTNDIVANVIRLQSNLTSTDNETYNQYGWWNYNTSGITANCQYGAAFDTKTYQWIVNNRPGAAINANNIYLGAEASQYVNRLYNFQFNRLSSTNGAVAANYAILLSNETANSVSLTNNKVGTTAVAANSIYLNSNETTNTTTISNYNSGGNHVLASSISASSVYSDSYQYNLLRFTNNNVSGTNMNFVYLDHMPTSNWNRLLFQNNWISGSVSNWIQCSNANTTSDFQFYNYHNNGNLANTFYMTTASNSGRLELTNRNSSGGVRTGLYMNTNGSFEISTNTGGAQRITMNQNGNLDVVGNNVVYIGTTNSSGYVSMKTGGTQKDLYFDSNGYLRGR